MNPHSENLHPGYGDMEDTNNEVIPMHVDRFNPNSALEKDGLYGLIILPVIGIVVSILILIARKYEIHGVLRCLETVQRVIGLRARNNENFDAELNTPPGSSANSISTISHISPDHIYFWDDLMEYDPSIEINSTSVENSSNDVLYVHSAVQTSIPELTLAEEEQFSFVSNDDNQDLSPLEEDEIIYINIKEPNLNEDIMKPTEIMHKDEAKNSTTRSGKRYK